jgi:ABC-type transporter Mla maintaining outer membrane lipid asymmetry ATPase subunit MlaF/ABC-type transporter Mla maintaining outer membrane lipid asymmetry permease subunit MlaE
MTLEPASGMASGTDAGAGVKLPLLPTNGEPAIRIRDLTIEVGGRVLFERASLDVFPGERVLLAGPSGSGKSVLLRLLSGLLDPYDRDHRVSGTVVVAGLSVLGGERGRTRTGLVFQDHALFDELTAGENVLFARDHSDSPNAAAAAERALAFLEAHAIDARARVRSLSGGQRQRVAIARAVARDPQVLLYDEPTSSLDPRSARAVAELIGEAGDAFGKASIIVTHDYAPFEGKATRVVYLDAQARAFRDVTFDELARVMAEARVAPLPVEAPPGPASPVARVSRTLKTGATVGLAGASTFLEETPPTLARLVRKAPYALWPIGARARWFARSFAHFARITFVGSAIPYMTIAGVIAGFVTTYFTFHNFPKKQWTEQLVLDEVLPSLGAALYRVIVPVLATILIAGRTGAALASDLGNRVYLQKISAMRTLGARPEAYVETASLWANVLGTLALTAIAFWSSVGTSLAVFAWTQPRFTPYYWATHFFTKLGPFHVGLAAKGAGWVFAKLVISGAGTAFVAQEAGLRPKKSAAEVSRAITATVYWATLFVLVVHLGFAFFEFDKLDDVLAGPGG